MYLMESAEAIANAPFFVWMIDQLRAIAALRVPFLTAIMFVVTYLGHEMVFLVVAMILVWCLNKRYGYRFLAIFLIGSFLQQALKAAFMIPRPWILDPTFRGLVVESAIKAASGYSFPSGHTLTAVITLGGFALYLKKKWAYAAAAVLSLVVAFSRMYLGVHTLLDVAVGLLLGLIVLAVFAILFRGEKERSGLLSAIYVIGVAASIGLLVYLLANPLPADPAYHPMALESIDNAYVLVGAGVGVLIGKFIDDCLLKYRIEAPWYVQLLKVLCGLLIAVGLRFGLKKLFGGDAETPLLHGVRYLLLTVVCVGVYPLLFRVFDRIGRRKKA